MINDAKLDKKNRLKPIKDDKIRYSKILNCILAL